MVNIPTKVTTDTLTATEFNQLPDEMEQVVTDSGQTPNSGILDQVSKGIATITSNVDYYTDGGGADAYVLSVIAPNKAPQSYRNGMRVRFRTTNANTGASTVNVVSLGIKNIKLQDGTTDPAAGQIPDDREIELVYDNTSFRLVSSGIELDSTTTVKGISYLGNKITIANNGVDANNDIDFSAGVFDFSDGSGQAVLSALTKRLDASWVAGDGNGGLDTGSKAIDTWYDCYSIYNPTTGISDALFSISPTSPTMPIGYTKKKLITSVLTDGSGNLIPFTQDGDYIEFKTRIRDVNSAPTVTKDAYPISTPPRTVKGHFGLTYHGSTTEVLFVYNNDDTIINSSIDDYDGTAYIIGTQHQDDKLEIERIVDSSELFVSSPVAINTFLINTLGWKEIK